jgi:hypothetical protein
LISSNSLIISSADMKYNALLALGEIQIANTYVASFLQERIEEKEITKAGEKVISGLFVITIGNMLLSRIHGMIRTLS